MQAKAGTISSCFTYPLLPVMHLNITAILLGISVHSDRQTKFRNKPSRLVSNRPLSRKKVLLYFHPLSDFYNRAQSFLKQYVTQRLGLPLWECGWTAGFFDHFSLSRFLFRFPCRHSTLALEESTYTHWQSMEVFIHCWTMTLILALYVYPETHPGMEILLPNESTDMTIDP